MMGSIRFSGCQSEDPFICFGTKPTQKACAQDSPRDQMREGKVPEREQRKADNRSQQNRAVGRRGQELGPVDSEARLANMRG